MSVLAESLIAHDEEAFAIRMSRLRTVCSLLSGLHRDYSECLVAEKRAKAASYLESDARSNGERESYASAYNVELTAETLHTKGQIQALEEEKAFLVIALDA